MRITYRIAHLPSHKRVLMDERLINPSIMNVLKGEHKCKAVYVHADTGDLYGLTAYDTWVKVEITVD